MVYTPNKEEEQVKQKQVLLKIKTSVQAAAENNSHTICTICSELKMGHFTLLAVIAVLFSLFAETEAGAFVYNYERLRIAGLICSGFLFIGGLAVILYNKCSRGSKKDKDDSSEI
ncbi:FXYD domain-containing ion transport regulator 11 [Syngnathus scovelli]|uniref:FXYD domain-containing ion transport regulator 11 n=1 Tax=Syngnathus scovelli TaxID=161590 RepID=UPI00210F2411|nr:FXYD domain-containing ion transport regulator 11 [Syngnathus scovelli]